MDFRQIQDPKIRQLAETLKQNGLAASESEATRMAQSMISTENKVNQHFDENKNTSSMIRNYQAKPQEPVQQAPIVETPLGQPPQTSAGAQQSLSSAPQQVPATQQPWENEVKAQDQPAAAPQQQPAPTHANNAIAEAIGNVQAQFNQQQTQAAGAQATQPAPPAMPEERAPPTPTMQTQQQQQESIVETPIEQTPTQIPKPQPTQGQELRTPNMTQIPTSNEEFIQPMQQRQENEPQTPVMQAQQQESVVETPIEQTPIQTPEPLPTQQGLPQGMSTAEAAAAAQETEAPEAMPATPQTPVMQAQTPNTTQIPISNEEFIQPMQQRQENEPQTPVMQTQQQQQAPDAAQPEEEEGMVEKTQEVFDKPPAKDLSKFEESRVDLSNVFNFNK